MSARDSAVRPGSRGGVPPATPERRTRVSFTASPSTGTAGIGKAAAPKASAALALAMQVGGTPAKRDGCGRRCVDASGGRRAFSNGPAPRASAYAPKAPPTFRRFESAYRLHPNLKDDSSPRLLPLGFSTMEPSGAPLLPPQTNVDLEGEERFCTAGPNLDGLGGAKRFSSSLSADVAFNELVSRLGRTMNQASLLLNDRLRTLKNKCSNANLGEAQQAELCEISDGVGAAAYHVQKWAYVLGRGGQFQRPTKPSRSESVGEAFAAIHFSLPKLMVNTTQAYELLDAIVKAHEDCSETHVTSLGVSPDDIRAMMPHLERLLQRLGRLSTTVKPDTPLSAFIPEHFAPAIGKTLARALVPYLI